MSHTIRCGETKTAERVSQETECRKIRALTHEHGNRCSLCKHIQTHIGASEKPRIFYYINLTIFSHCFGEDIERERNGKEFSSVARHLNNNVNDGRIYTNNGVAASKTRHK